MMVDNRSLLRRAIPMGVTRFAFVASLVAAGCHPCTGHQAGAANNRLPDTQFVPPPKVFGNPSIGIEIKADGRCLVGTRSLGAKGLEEVLGKVPKGPDGRPVTVRIKADRFAKAQAIVGVMRSARNARFRWAEIVAKDLRQGQPSVYRLIRVALTQRYPLVAGRKAQPQGRQVAVRVFNAKAPHHSRALTELEVKDMSKREQYALAATIVQDVGEGYPRRQLTIEIHTGPDTTTQQLVSALELSYLLGTDRTIVLQEQRLEKKPD